MVQEPPGTPAIQHYVLSNQNEETGNWIKSEYEGRNVSKSLALYKLTKVSGVKRSRRKKTMRHFHKYYLFTLFYVHRLDFDCLCSFRGSISQVPAAWSITVSLSVIIQQLESIEPDEDSATIVEVGGKVSVHKVSL